MKKIIILLAASLAIGLCAFAQSSSKENRQMNTLVAYFSASGVTRSAAVELADVAGADIYEIKPEKPYTNADLDWRDAQSRSSIEMQNRNSRPAISGTLRNMHDYDVVYVGFPIWWYTCPTIINTFMETYDFSGKVVTPFATSGGSSIKQACVDLKASYPAINWKEGKLLNHVPKAELMKWVESNR